jgi:hypothetical protein
MISTVTKINRIDQKIYKLYEEKRQIQTQCQHPELEGIYESDIGNYSKSDDCSWVLFFCPDCHKRWREEQNEVYYDHDTKTVKSKEGYAFKKVGK